MLRDGPQPRVELAGPGLLRLPLPLHLRPLLHPRVPAVARLQRRGGPRLQVHGAHQGRGVRRHRRDQVLGWGKVVVVVVTVANFVFVFFVVVPAIPAVVFVFDVVAHAVPAVVAGVRRHRRDQVLGRGKVVVVVVFVTAAVFFVLLFLLLLLLFLLLLLLLLLLFLLLLCCSAAASVFCCANLHILAL